MISASFSVCKELQLQSFTEMCVQSGPVLSRGKHRSHLTQDTLEVTTILICVLGIWADTFVKAATLVQIVEITLAPYLQMDMRMDR